MASEVERKQAFDQALKQETCDVVDDMLAKGYIPDPSSIEIVYKKGNLTLLQTLLYSGKYDVDVQAGLFRAINYKQIHLLDHLYVFGANVNCLDEYGTVPLNHACDRETCKWLMDMGAQQTSGMTGMTPLHSACSEGYLDVVELLLSKEQGIQSICLTDSRGRTPLSCVVWCCGKANVARLLLAHELGAQSISITDNDGNTPLKLACFLTNIELVRLLLSYKQGVETINQPNKDGITALDQARHSPEILALLQNAVKNS